jgi:hypothetical protein
MNRVWIELDKPEDDEHAEQIVRAANAMMAKLGIEHNVFSWYPEKEKYALHYANNSGFVYLPDRGWWFDLDYLASTADEA